MSQANDYSGEMPGPRQIDDATAEQLLAGRTVPPELESVATVMRALREVSAQPIRPSTTLREQMAAGVFTGSPVYSYRTNPDGRLRRVATVLVAWLARLRLGTKLAAAGVAVAVLSVGSAGFAGTLPAPVQDRFETVVESVTPYQFPEKTANRDGDSGSTDDEGPVDEESVGGRNDQGGANESPSPTAGPGNGNGNGNNGSGNGNGNGSNGNGNGNNGNNGNGNGNNGNGNGNNGNNGNGN